VSAASNPTAYRLVRSRHMADTERGEESPQSAVGGIVSMGRGELMCVLARVRTALHHIVKRSPQMRRRTTELLGGRRPEEGIEEEPMRASEVPYLFDWSPSTKNNAAVDGQDRTADS